MLTLYYAPGACSLAVHIALLENEIPFNLKRVDLATKKLEDSSDYLSVNIKGYVPAIQVESGELLTENPAILFYIAEQNPLNEALRTPGVFSRYRLLEALSFVSSELHKTLGAFFDPKLPEEYKEKLATKLKKRFTDMEIQFSNSEYLAGNSFTVADGYCFTILRWLPFLDTGLTMSSWPRIEKYFERIKQRPKVQEALRQEDLAR